MSSSTASSLRGIEVRAAVLGPGAGEVDRWLVAVELHLGPSERHDLVSARRGQEQEPNAGPNG